MKRKLIACTLCLLLVLSVTACGAERRQEDKGNLQNEAENAGQEKRDTVEEEGIAQQEEKAVEEEGTIPEGGIQYEYTEEGIIKPEIAERVIKETAEKVLTAISERDMKTLAQYVHPEKGVRFTPYTYVQPDQDIVFNKEQIEGFFEDKKTYLWGHYDGTGDEIRLTPAEYYEKFIYTADFLNAEQVGYNTVLSFGNALENQFEVYDNPIVVEYYFSGFNPDYAGMDWQSLRLVFEEYNSKLLLVGIIHNQWTI